MKAHPSALREPDPRGSYPLHIACQYETLNVVKFMAELYGSPLDICDDELEYPLHFACRTGNCDVVKYLLERQTASVSARNEDNELPIELLCRPSEPKIDIDSPEYVETIWLLLLAHPDVVMAN